LKLADFILKEEKIVWGYALPAQACDLRWGIVRPVGHTRQPNNISPQERMFLSV